ncbi:MAG: signal peptidase I [Paracoccus sp. (in: a-proteobacteria)]|nr:signal peptidase I [Paracoccus sp. (in: a-proteobacteria)]
MASSVKKNDGIWETVKTVFWALLIAGVFRTLFFQPFWIPSGSMKDTLLIGDFLFVNKMAYGYSAHSCPFSACPFDGRILAGAPERGDVVVFRHPTLNVDYIKRAVGLPGDTVAMVDGVLQINGEAVTLEPTTPFAEPKEPQGPARLEPLCTNDPVPPGGECLKDRYVETFPDGSGAHHILNIMDGNFLDNMAPVTVPPQHYFFVGDNRDNSLDSRVPAARRGLGMVHEDYLIGRADRIMFSSAGSSLLYFWTWRADRFFKAVN